MVEVGRHINIELLTLSEITSVTGEAGDFQVGITQHPRYVDMDKCIACGLCAEKCPKKVDDEYNEGLVKRKAAYVKYAQAVPLKYAIDAENCIYLTKGKCRACEKLCPSQAISFDQQKKELNLNVGAIVLAPGTNVYDPQNLDYYGYSKHSNIVTSLEFERMLAASGPTMGHLVRPSDHEEPKKIAWLQCVGSRDTHPGAKGYCSSVCCTYAIKEAVVASEHAKGGLDTAIFYIDIRTHGKDFERYMNRAADSGVRFIKSRISTITPVDKNTLSLGYVDAAGKRIDEEFDVVVLSVGLCMPAQAAEFGKKLGIEFNDQGYPAMSSFDPVKTSVPGIYVCGAYESPKDIPQSVVDASACAGSAASLLAESRKSLVKTREIPSEQDVSGQEPRIGVFICRCGVNIASVVDVPGVVEYARSLPHVTHVEDNLFSCSQDTQDKMTKIIRENNLNRIVVAACTPRTHEPLFQETVTNAGLNKFLFEMANIRNQCSWVHANEPEAATAKAKDLVRMAVSRAALLEPLPRMELGVNRAALVVGGGIAGMNVAKNLADQGFEAHLVETDDALGGKGRSIASTWKNEDVQGYLSNLISDVRSNDKIHVHLNSHIDRVDGFVGNFETTISDGNRQEVVSHGAAIIATGADEWKPDLYRYGEDPRVLTGLDLDRKFMEVGGELHKARNAVFIQCVGSRIPERPYCSKVCCTHSVRNALKLKELNPYMNVYIVYRDMRTYGLRESLFREARQKGVHFVRYVHDNGITVEPGQDALSMRFTDYVLQREIELRPDLLVLASAIVMPRENPLAQMFKAPLNDDRFYVEAHAKLRPVEFPTDGLFVCGLAHGPKPIDEAIAQAQAAASRAAVVLSRDMIQIEGVVSKIDEELCRGCGQCQEVCPFKAINIVQAEGGGDRVVARVTEAVCKGCGKCASVCPTGAASIRHFTDEEIITMVDAALED